MKKLPKRPGGPTRTRPGRAATNKPARPPARPAGRQPSAVRRPVSPWIKIFALGVLLLATLAIASGGCVYLLARRSLPLIDGSAQLSSLTAPVEVLRDSNRVPHIFGADVRDLIRAMGFVHAQDRFFQMEMARRTASGTLAEIFGEEAIEPDRQARLFGLAAAAGAELERMAPEAREVLEAYASGVNAYLEAHGDKLPPELSFLRLRPSPWQPQDSLAVGRILSDRLSENGTVELLRSRLADAVGIETAYRLTGLEPPVGNWAQSWPRGIRTSRRSSHTGASNAWVVSGRRSRSGRPLLASDPHLDLAMPSVWYQIHLSGGGLEVAGASLPGLPFVIIGRNSRIAWGATALYADVQDVYIEPPDTAVDVISETIQVKDRAAVIEEVRVSRHGVVVGETADGRLLAQRWDSFWSGDHVQALLRLNRAGSWEAFTDALRTWSSPSISFIYADVEGNIGFFPAGEIPVRTAHDGTLPVDGESEEFEWKGVVPHELKPMVFNPPEGFIVSANHSMLPPETAYPLGADTLSAFRTIRIRDLLEAIPELSLDDFERLQNDRYDGSTEAILRRAVAVAPSDPTTSLAVDRLRGWSGRMAEGSAPAIYWALYDRLLRNTFADELGDELFESYLDFLEPGRPGGLHAIVDDEGSPFWDDRSTAETEDRHAIFSKSLGEAVELLTDLMGNDVDGWDWRTLHGVVFRHPLARVRPMGYFLNRGPIPFGGSTSTIANAVVSLRHRFDVSNGTSFRFVTDLAAPDRSRSVVPTGASGHPLSSSYFDQNAAWLSGQNLPLAFSRGTIESTASGKLFLSP
ncbi:MAG TPA: penicillin acylase family protein [Vicinamibacteria bacterium]|nr:penicillin acylase family protein [Vicinamibacteria bacterium]